MLTALLFPYIFTVPLSPAKPTHTTAVVRKKLITFYG